MSKLSERTAAVHEERAAYADRRTYNTLMLARDAVRRGDRRGEKLNKRLAWNHESNARKDARAARRIRERLDAT